MLDPRFLVRLCDSLMNESSHLYCFKLFAHDIIFIVGICPFTDLLNSFVKDSTANYRNQFVIFRATTLFPPL